jgi:hypothetical protein
LDYTDFPRPKEQYYEVRHDFLSQGDILRDVPFAQLGPSINVLESVPDGLPIPDGTVPAMTFVAHSAFGIVLSNTCDFRHAGASTIRIEPKDYFHAPKSIYESGYVRVAPIFPLDHWHQIPRDESKRDTLRDFDLFRKLMYLPELRSAGLPESAVGIHMADSLHIDLLLGLERVTQLTRIARQQLNFKLVWFDTGFGLPRDQFNPDLG